MVIEMADGWVARNLHDEGVVMTVDDFTREHAGHDVRLFCEEVVDVTYYASVEDGAIVTDWEVRDTYNADYVRHRGRSRGWPR